jgi:hypothetical protein
MLPYQVGVSRGRPVEDEAMGDIAAGKVRGVTMSQSCPGARLIKEPRPEYVRCSHCQNEVEMWSDEFRVRCTTCQAWVYREAGASCLDWCAQAEQCVGAAALAAYRRAGDKTS